MSAARGRLQAIDVTRGLAILAMAAYHTAWDLTYTGLIQTGIGVDPLWISVQRAILTSFLLLAGAGLVLGHAGGIDWRSFWRREAVLIAAALAVTAGTWFLFQEYFSYFGVLHAIAVTSLLALPFTIAPLWMGIAAAAIALFLPLAFSSEAFDPRWLNWIGFFRTTPETADLVPVFPWLGVVLIGVVGMRLLRDAPAFAWRSQNPAIRALAFAGRWSLVIYLVHQPLLFGLITPLANWVHSAEQTKLESFVSSCRASCALRQAQGEGGGTEKFCTAYCSCALDLTVRDSLWAAIDASPRTAEQQGAVDRMGKLCTAMAR
ncbi:MAG: heparan-alpha-glucosaminide N-acetyltransferase [Devosia sp.]|nr:heparan-alpha-glucosaminide N-acetyltransferase [Devosia sp.]